MTLEVTGSNPVIYLNMLSTIELLEHLDWAQKRFNIVKQFQRFEHCRYKIILKYFSKKKNVKKNWYFYKPYLQFTDYIKYIKLFKIKKKIFIKIFKFLIKYNGIYRKIFMHMKTLKFYFKGHVLLRHCILKFIFTSQQIFFQLFTKNSYSPDTHTTVGTLIRVRENIREHGGKYVYRLAEEKEFSAKEILRDKKYIDYFRRTYDSENIRNMIVKKKLIQPKVMETKELKLRKAKRELLLKNARKKNKNIENLITYNKRGNPKTEPLYGKCHRRRFNAWLWFIKCVFLYIKNKNIKIFEKIIINISGYIKTNKQILKYILSTFKKKKIAIFLIKLNLKYRGAKLKHFTTIKKKARKRYVKMEQKSFFL